MSTTITPDDGPRVRVTADVGDYVGAVRSTLERSLREGGLTRDEAREQATEILADPRPSSAEAMRRDDDA